MQPDPMLYARAHVHAGGGDELDAIHRAVDQRIERKDDPRIVAQMPQRFRQTADHIGKAADFCERHAFGRDEEDFQTVLVLAICWLRISFRMFRTRHRHFGFGYRRHAVRKCNRAFQRPQASGCSRLRRG